MVGQHQRYHFICDFTPQYDFNLCLFILKVVVMRCSCNSATLYSDRSFTKNGPDHLDSIWTLVSQETTLIRSWTIRIVIQCRNISSPVSYHDFCWSSSHKWLHSHKLTITSLQAHSILVIFCSCHCLIKIKKLDCPLHLIL